MKLPFGVSAIILTFVFSAAGSAKVHASDREISACELRTDTVPNLDWLADLSKSLDASVADDGRSPRVPKVEKLPQKTPPPPKPVVPKPTAPKVESVDEEEPLDAPVGKYDLSNAPPEKWLAKMTSAARWSAKVCRKGICNSHKSKYMCYRGVKDALAKAGMVDGWWAEEAAVNAHRKGTLEKRGFRNVMAEGFNVKNAPLGSVLVYSGGKWRCADDRGRRGKLQCGHIEIKVNQTEYCSDFCTNHPVRNRKLVGVYVKE